MVSPAVKDDDDPAKCHSEKRGEIAEASATGTEAERGYSSSYYIYFE